MTNIVPLERVPSNVEAERIIKKLVELGEISWTKHCKERMKQRDITIQQIINCLTRGTITESPFFTYKNGGGYEMCVERIVAGEWLKVVICLKLTQKMLVITAIN